MHYRRFGQTEQQLSVFSLGTMRCLASADIFTQTVQQALNSGINHIETAIGYGQSEVYLGQALRELDIPRSQLYITTKIPPTPDAATMAQQIEQSLARLDMGYIDNLAIHGINTPEHLQWVTAEQGCMSAVREAVQAGQIHHVGFSTHGSLELILDAIATGLFAFVNLHYYLFFQRHAAAIELAHQRDMGIFIISPTDKGGQLYTPPEKLRQLCQPYSPLELNYRFLLSDPRITTLSVGAATPDELYEPLTICDRTDTLAPLTPLEQQTLQQLDQAQTDALGCDRCQQCHACLPCPEEINIPEVLRLRNLAVAYDMTTFGQYRYRMFENAGHWFPGKQANRCTECGDCLPRCPERLEIPRLLFDTHDRLQGPARRRLWG
ncbi:MAG: aldo/keto reductase [Thainema sp.]